jgi:hypothetical protein
LIEQTRQNLTSEEDLNFFNGKLQLNGFLETHREINKGPNEWFK